MDSAVATGIIAGFALLVSPATTRGSPQEIPRQVLEQYCELDAQGKQLTPDGWNQVAMLFITAGAPRLDKVVIIKDFVVSNPNLREGKAEFYVEYIQLGMIESSTAKFLHLPPVKVRAGFDLVLTNKPVGVGPGGSGTKMLGSPQWRIDGAIPEPHLTVDAAIRYAVHLRDQAPDESTRRHAEAAIAALKRLRPHSG